MITSSSDATGAERKAGELLASMDLKSISQKANDSVSLADIGVTPKQSSRWQLAAKLPANPQTCTPHNDPANYIDIQVGNRTRTTCRVCKKFIGYRTVK